MNDPKPFLDRPGTVKGIVWGLAIVCAGLALFDFFYHRHAHYEVEALPAFYAVYGFVAYVGLVLVAKQLRKLLKRDEDYYGDDGAR